MPKEIDEDLIEATIRRVAESKAARAVSPPIDTQTNEPAAPDEDPIEATIRRVAESKAARAASPPTETASEESVASDEDPIEATIRRVAEAKAARAASPPVETPTSESVAPEEDPIEATIRRVAESKAARAASAPIEMPVSESVAPVFVPSDEPEAAQVEREPWPASEAWPAPAPASEAAPIAESAPEIPAGPAPMEPEPIRLPRRQPRSTGALAAEWTPPATQGGDVGEQLRAIAERLDAIVPLLERIAQGGQPEPRGEWDRAPRHSSPQPHRPPPVRENDGDVIDTRPLPAPLPPLVEPKRGLDLLPRTYRITVEDKRRGVDLVPLHRAMLGIEGARDMSLLNYTNGTAIVALETEDELDPESVRLAMQNAMKRDARIEVHNESTMVVKLTPED